MTRKRIFCVNYRKKQTQMTKILTSTKVMTVQSMCFSKKLPLPTTALINLKECSQVFSSINWPIFTRAWLLSTIVTQCSMLVKEPVKVAVSFFLVMIISSLSRPYPNRKVMFTYKDLKNLQIISRATHIHSQHVSQEFLR